MRNRTLATTAALSLLAALLAPYPSSAETRITISDRPSEAAPARLVAPSRSDGLVPLAAALEPSPGPWVVPFVVETGNPFGTTTLLSVRNENEVPGAVDVLVEFYDDTLTQFHSTMLSLAPNQLQSFNLRDQPGLPATGLHRGFVRITPSPGELVSTDYFLVTPGEDFASGGLGIDYTVEKCQRWKVRVLEGGPFSGGTTLLFLIDGPHGADPGDTPSVTGDVYNEAGGFINSFTIRTDAWVLEVDAADLILPANLFGAIELSINSTLDGGWVRAEHKAEGRYSVGLHGVCRDNVPVP